MENVKDVLSVFETCLHVCLAFTILFFVISVVLFFLFDIKTIFSIKTGRAKKKTVREMQAANNKTGRLRVDGKTMTAKLDKTVKKKEKTQPVIVTPTAQNEVASAPTEVLMQEPDAADYSEDVAPTTQLSSADTDNKTGSSIIRPENIVDTKFSVTKKVILIHTDEVIS